MTSPTQISANQKNAQKSTGPITKKGKTEVAKNAIKHGIFSKKLLLADEDPIEYQNLLLQLQSELAPVGILEQTLVERITISLWRQKRLVQAESAYTELDRQPKNIASAIIQELNLSYSAQSLFEEDLTEFDPEQYKWCQEILKEYKTYDFDTQLNLENIEKSAPLIYQQLLNDADEDNKASTEYLQSFAFDQPTDYFSGLANYCRQKIKQSDQRSIVLKIAEMVRNKRAILHDKAREGLAKYQVMLDNELYKALKALREAQEWRFKSLPIIPDEIGFVLENET